MRPALFALCALTSACVAGDPPTASTESTAVAASTLAFHRDHVTADIYHYELSIRVGTSPNATLRIHRVVRELAPFVPRPANHAVMLMHGDFATFTTSFVPVLGDPASPVAGLAPYLAARNIDVWGVDRRWTTIAADGDLSDLGEMGVAQEVDDIHTALVFARAARLGGSAPALLGFSHGAQLAYAYASVDAARPRALRTISGLVALDFYGDYGPEQADDRAATCEYSAEEYQYVADGFTDSPNDFFIEAGRLARTAPDDPSPLIPDYTNRGTLLLLLGQTYEFAAFAPFYHLLSPIVEDGQATDLRETTLSAATAWLEGAPPHQSMLESADLDALLCGDAPLPIDAPLSRIRVPLLYIGAGGGIGTYGLHATTQVRSTDVTAFVVQLFDETRRADDYGHGDLLFASSAESRVWQPLAAWLSGH